jgi:hypothetical protein
VVAISFIKVGLALAAASFVLLKWPWESIIPFSHLEVVTTFLPFFFYIYIFLINKVNLPLEKKKKKKNCIKKKLKRFVICLKNVLVAGHMWKSFGNYCLKKERRFEKVYKKYVIYKFLGKWHFTPILTRFTRKYRLLKYIMCNKFDS